ncbi:MAG: cytochrome c oxidase subunit 4 [Pseudonocardiaceae bacterium]
MKIEARIFEFMAVFFFLSDVVYGLWSHDPAGTAGLTLSGGLALILGTYLRFVARRVQMRPEDNSEAEISDGAGEMGFFSPGSYWPIGMAGAASVIGLGLAFDQWWMVVLGVVSVLGTVAGLIFEYHIGPKAE